MRKSITLFLGVALFWGGCKEIEEIKNFAISHPFSKIATLDVPATGPDSFDFTLSFDVTDDQEFKNNLDQISGYNLKKLSYKIDSFTGDPATIGSGMIQFMANGAPVGSAIHVGDIHFKKLHDDQTVVTIEIDEELKTLIETTLKDNASIQLKIMGSIDHQPVVSDIEFIIELEALVKV